MLSKFSLILFLILFNQKFTHTYAQEEPVLSDKKLEDQREKPVLSPKRLEDVDEQSIISTRPLDEDVPANENPDEEISGSWDSIIESFSLLAKGSYYQFKEPNNITHAAWGFPAIWYSFEHDKRIKNRYGGTKIAAPVDIIGDLGVALNFPILPIGFYILGRKTGNNHHVQFAKEYFATMYLALIESGLLSFIQVHNRPVVGDESFWEEAFRGDSSWPSGHVVPYMTLFFKTLQFYGPAYATIPLVLSIAASMQRIQDNKHWLSDVTTSLVLSAWASEGVRKAAGYSKNHSFYKWVFEHEAQVGVVRYKGKLGPRISWLF